MTRSNTAAGIALALFAVGMFVPWLMDESEAGAYLFGFLNGAVMFVFVAIHLTLKYRPAPVEGAK